MKKSLLKAFTLIELIVVISIITITSASWVFYFLDYVKNQEITQKIKLIENNINQIDKDIKKYEIFDYEMFFNTSNLSLWYITYLNNFDIPYKQTLILDTITWSWNISIPWEVSLTWTLKLYKKQKLFLNKQITYNESMDFDFNTDSYYKIKSTLSWETLNDININYFWEDNINPEKNNNIYLTKIEDEYKNIINELIVKNIWWNKTFFSWALELNDNEIYLYFENNWIEKFIKISK
jgi:prepilin-type N-terminal cleavage/methylation domain-containing protein